MFFSFLAICFSIFASISLLLCLLHVTVLNLVYSPISLKQKWDKTWLGVPVKLCLYESCIYVLESIYEPGIVVKMDK